MNNLFGINASLSSLAKDFNGFVREVVEELGTVQQDDAEENNDDGASQRDAEQAIEEELKHQLLQLSDDEDGGSAIRTQNAEEYDAKENDNQTETQVTEQQQSENEETEKQNITIEEYDALQRKYVQLKQNYRNSMTVVEKYQIYNKSLKETLNEQMIMREQQQSQIDQYQTVNDELNNKIVELHQELESMKQSTTTTQDHQVSIFEDDSTSEMVVKSVSLNQNKNEDENNNKDEVDKLRKTLQKASTNMKELKKRYKKIKDDLCTKIEEFDRLKSQYVDFKMSSSNKVQQLKNTLNQVISKQSEVEDGVSRALQIILNSQLYLNDEECKFETMNPLHLEMISVLNGCIETMSWWIDNAMIGKYGSNNLDDTKSDSVVIVEEMEPNANVCNVPQLESIKTNVVSLREIVCEFIAVIQQWLKVLNDGIERKHDMMSNGKSKSITEEFQNID